SPRLRIEVGAGHEPRRADSQRRLEQPFGHQEQPRGLRRKHPSVPTQISTEAKLKTANMMSRVRYGCWKSCAKVAWASIRTGIGGGGGGKARPYSRATL